ncbi:putative oxidoreductase [Arthrobacter sp. PAMC 25486]|nr:putative oxidoreductase [Arthrobacter sp. PAMC 25486]
MGLGGSWDDAPYGAAEVDQAAEAIEAARHAGITLFDHADIYRKGKSEQVFGDVLAATPGLREQLLIQTKCGIRQAGDGLPGRYDLSAGHLLASVNGSLQRLRTDYVDVLLLHRPDPLMDPGEVAGAVNRLMGEGKIRALGVSNMSAAQITHLQDRLETPVVANQLDMSLGRRAWVESTVLVNQDSEHPAGFPHGTLEHAAAHGIELQAYGSLAKGRYSGNPTGAAADSATAGLVQALAQGWNTTAEAVVLGWLMRHPARISPVIGTTSPARIAACADAPRIAAEMSREAWYALWTQARGAALP